MQHEKIPLVRFTFMVCKIVKKWYHILSAKEKQAAAQQTFVFL
jgi:hypothetical protein